LRDAGFVKLAFGNELLLVFLRGFDLLLQVFREFLLEGRV